MNQSRVLNTFRNTFVGFGSYFFIAILSFVRRAVFIRTLGVDYLGVGGLYSNILSVLALSDLGLYTVMVFSLYKPLAENDTNRITVLINYYHKLYLIIAGVIAILGIACIPILPFIVNTELLSYKELVVYYLLSLANSVCSYFAITKSTLIRADQQLSIIQIVNGITSFVMHLLQILFLLLYHNYVIYLAIPIITTLLNNYCLTHIANRRYPYLKNKANIKTINNDIKIEVINNLKATFLYKLGATIITSTDNILISVLLGTAMVGYYNNYFIVVAMVNSIIMILINSVLASIGNYNATMDPKSKYELFQFMLFCFFGIAAFTGSCYLSIFDDFISLWLGSKYILDNKFLYCLVFNCTISTILNPVWMTRESSGIFTSVRYVVLIAAFINLVTSILFAKYLGLTGIILGTATAHLTTLFWYEPLILCKKVFHVNFIDYIKKIIVLFAALIPSTILGIYMHSLFTSNIFLMIAKVILCGAIVVITFYLLFKKSKELNKLFEILQKAKNTLLKNAHA